MSRTSGSEGGPQKPTSRKTGRALRPDPYTEHPTREGKIYCCVVIDAYSRRVVGWAILPPTVRPGHQRAGHGH